MKHEIRLTAQKLAQSLELIAPWVYLRRQPLVPFRFQVIAEQAWPVVDPQAEAADWPEIAPFTYWGGRDVNFVLRGQFAVPAGFAADGEVALYLPLGDAGGFCHPEALVYVDGEPYGTVDRHHQELLLRADWLDGRSHTLTLHGWTGGTGFVPGQQLFMGDCALVQIDQPTREFLTLARIALQTANLLDDLEPIKARLYNVLDAAYQQLDLREPWGADFYASISVALDGLREGIAAAGPPLEVEIIAAGHAHIDVAWLWTLAQTRRKAGRTFHTVLRLMEQFPDYHFTQSQPQLYDFVRQDYPALFAAIQTAVRDGRWEPIGGMWVEADCNLTGPESLARQFLLGRTFFREQFGAGVESPVLWLPDVFGYAWSLPQLIKSAGMDYFFTIKIGWNRVNKMPFDSFWWQGIDGTKVLTHFSTTPETPWGGAVPTRDDLLKSATYNADLTAFTALGSWANLKHKETQRVMLMSYGYGDGGGGPTREMNENARELAAFPGLPRVKQGKVIDFFRRLEAESGAELPTWNNELYLEIHRGTYTTQSRNKRANRTCEFLLHDAEFLAALAALLEGDYVYPHDRLRQAWQLLCLNQFHDIIPGSSITAVYADSQRQYAEIEALGTAVVQSAIDVLAEAVGGDVLLLNPTGFARRDLAFWAGTLPAGQRFAGGVVTQVVDGGTLLGGVEMAGLSVRPFTIESGPIEPIVSDLSVTPAHLENACLRVEFNAAGDITRMFDKSSQREVLPLGAIANQWQAFDDRPLNWDAWDIDIYYDDKLYLAEAADSIRVVESGPLRATLEIRRRILHSSYIQRVSLCTNSPQLDFATVIAWQEKHVLLKVAFPVAVLSPVATYEIQWGSVQRPTHRNTSWDWARFETAAQKWVDLSEGGYGVALLNDCKYGHDIRDNVMRLSLLRAPTDPDPEADQGEHRFAYSLLPHANAPGSSVTPSTVAQRAYALNDPLRVVATNRPLRQTPEPLARVPENIVVETVKQAEDGNGVIVRFYECNRQRGPITLAAGFALQAAYRCNVLEENEARLPVVGRRVDLVVRPFEIATVRLVPMA
ncbi:MAG: alpha-mannosidase [Chloroflexi bacterium]|nr:alpha-mannosidase [Chloroflexota bacterium]MBP7045289.1 alpha-mannosidase [Chloroflexota bacterium]